MAQAAATAVTQELAAAVRLQAVLANPADYVAVAVQVTLAEALEAGQEAAVVPVAFMPTSAHRVVMAL